MKKTSKSVGNSTDKSPAIIVVVVDANPSDYVALAPLAEAGEIDLRFLLSGRSALRERRYLGAPLWMINVHLPDRSGFDLFEMFFRRKTSPLVLMVADQYCTEDELRALKLGVAKYLCKPVDPAWLHDCLQRIKIESGHKTPPGHLKTQPTKALGKKSKQNKSSSSTISAPQDVRVDSFLKEAPHGVPPFFERSDS